MFFKVNMVHWILKCIPEVTIIKLTLNEPQLTARLLAHDQGPE